MRNARRPVEPVALLVSLPIAPASPLAQTPRPSPEGAPLGLWPATSAARACAAAECVERRGVRATGAGM